MNKDDWFIVLVLGFVFAVWPALIIGAVTYLIDPVLGGIVGAIIFLLLSLYVLRETK